MKPDSPLTPDDPRLTAFALGELEGAELEAVAAAVAADARLGQAVSQLRADAAAVRAQLLGATAEQPADSVALEAQVFARLEQEAAASPAGTAHSAAEHFSPADSASSVLADAPSPSDIDWERSLGRTARRPVVWWSPYALPLAACFVAVVTVGLLWWNGFTDGDQVTAPASLTAESQSFVAAPARLTTEPQHLAVTRERSLAEPKRLAPVAAYSAAAVAVAPERPAGRRTDSAADATLAKMPATASFADGQRRGEAIATAVAVANTAVAAESDTVAIAEIDTTVAAETNTTVVAESRSARVAPAVSSSLDRQDLFAPRVWAYRRSGRAVRTSTLTSTEGLARLAEGEALAEQTSSGAAADARRGSASAPQLAARGHRGAQPPVGESIATAAAPTEANPAEANLTKANPAEDGAAFDITTLLPAFTAQRSAANNGSDSERVAESAATGRAGNGRPPASATDSTSASPAVTTAKTVVSPETTDAENTAAPSVGEGAHTQATAFARPLPVRVSAEKGGATQATSVAAAQLLAEAAALVRPIEGAPATDSEKNAEVAKPVWPEASHTAGSDQGGIVEADADNGESGLALAAPLTPEQATVLTAAKHFRRASLAELEAAAFAGSNSAWKAALTSNVTPVPEPVLATATATAATVTAAAPLQAAPAAPAAARRLNLANRYVQVRLWIETGQLPPPSAVDVDAIVRDAAQTYASGALRRLRVRSLPAADGEITPAELEQLEAQSPLLQSVRAYAVLLRQRPEDTTVQLDALIAQVAERSKVAGSRSTRDFLKLLRSTRTLF